MLPRVLPWVLLWVPGKQSAAEPHSHACSRLATRLMAPGHLQTQPPWETPNQEGSGIVPLPQPPLCLVF